MSAFLIANITMESVLAFLTPLAVIVATVLQQWSAKQAAKQAAKDAQKMTAVASATAVKTEQVKQALAVTMRNTDAKLADIKDATDKVHILVNNQTAVMLKELADLSRWKATATGSAEDLRAAELAEQASRDHDAKQAAVDEREKK